MLVTPLQMARLAAAMANGGRLVKPHLLKSVRGVPEAAPRIERIDLGLKPSVIEAVRAGMISVVEEGTGRRTKLAGVTIGGKTGSSQVVASRVRQPTAHETLPHGWFVAFAPREQPQIAVAVLVEHAGSGGVAAAPVAREILAHFFQRPVAAPEPAVAD